MAQLTNSTKLDLSYKFANSVLATNVTWNWFSELFKNEVNILSSRIWATTPPIAKTFSDADVIASSGSCVTKIEMPLTLQSSHNNKLWRARTIYGNDQSPLILDGISPLDVPDENGNPSIGYTIRLYQDDGSGGIGQEILTTDGAWLWHYKLNCLILDTGYTAQDQNWKTPLHATFYKYSGNFGFSSNSGSANLDSIDISPDGILIVYDKNRNKWLSAERCAYNYGINHDNINGNRWLCTDANIPSNIVGYRMARNCTITNITSQLRGNCTAELNFKIDRNGSLIDIHQSILNNVPSRDDNNLNIDLQKGDQLKTVINGTNIHYPLVTVEIAWRY